MVDRLWRGDLLPRIPILLVLATTGSARADEAKRDTTPVSESKDSTTQALPHVAVTVRPLELAFFDRGLQGSVELRLATKLTVRARGGFGAWSVPNRPTPRVLRSGRERPHLRRRRLRTRVRLLGRPRRDLPATPRRGQRGIHPPARDHGRALPPLPRPGRALLRAPRLHGCIQLAVPADSGRASAECHASGTSGPVHANSHAASRPGRCTRPRLRGSPKPSCP